MSQRIRSSLAVLCLLLSTATAAHAWGAGGHMMVAQIAFDRLNPTAKAKARSLLAIPISPCDVTGRSPDFVNAAHWADDIRNSADFGFAQPYHFVDFPFSVDETPVPTDLPDPDENVLLALRHYVEVLKTSFDPIEQAHALRFVIHYVGDLHQPLHGSTRVSEELPRGDRGGNGFDVVIGNRTTNLHSYWDGGLDSFPRTGRNFRPPRLNKIPPAVAIALNGHPESDPALVLDRPFDYDRWAQESSELARSAAYDGIEPGDSPSTAYKARGLEVVRKRVAFAGYRLAALLNAVWPVSN